MRASGHAGEVRYGYQVAVRTGAWTIALRQGGVTAGGTFTWSWAIYRVQGQ